MSNRFFEFWEKLVADLPELILMGVIVLVAAVGAGAIVGIAVRTFFATAGLS